MLWRLKCEIRLVVSDYYFQLPYVNYTLEINLRRAMVFASPMLFQSFSLESKYSIT
jgi:hypothetical protein